MEAGGAEACLRARIAAALVAGGEGRGGGAGRCEIGIGMAADWFLVWSAAQLD
jgi:hypothetical protein